MLHIITVGRAHSHNPQNIIIVKEKHEEADNKAHSLVVVSVPEAAGVTRQKETKRKKRRRRIK